MALGKNLQSKENGIIAEQKELKTPKKPKTSDNVDLSTADAMAKELEEEIFNELPPAAQAKIKELNLKNDVLNKSCLISMTDKRGYITYVNDKFCEVAQYTREECIGSNHNMVRHPDMPKSVFKEVWATIGRGEMFVGNIKNRCKDGSHYWVDAYIAPILGANGKPEAYIGIRFDITDLMEAKDDGEALKQAIDLGWASIEFEPDGTILTANDNFLSVLGYSSVEEIKGKHHRIFSDSEYTSSPKYAKFWDDLGNGLSHSGEFKNISKSGNDVWMNASYTPVKDLNGKIVKVIKIANDISTVKLPVLMLSDIIGNMAQGDLTKRFEKMNAEEYVEEMGGALNAALENLTALLSNIEENSNLLGASSEQMLTKSDQMQGTTQEVASAIGQMAEGVQQQAEQIDESSKLLDGVRSASEEVATKSQEINKAADASQGSVKEGLDTVKKVVDSMNEIKESAATTSESISVLTERSEEIARTLNVITDIAAQTNLLALNAAIEAARAGDAGRGFAVVAEEIRKLAEDSRTSAGDIEKVISAVGKDIASAGKAIATMDSSVKVGNEASLNAESVFKEINTTTEQTLSLSVEVVSSAEIQKKNIDDTVKNIEKIVVVSEETAAGTEEIATSAKDLSNGMDEFNSTSKSLADIANQLQEGISKFKLRN